MPRKENEKKKLRTVPCLAYLRRGGCRPLQCLLQYTEEGNIWLLLFIVLLFYFPLPSSAVLVPPVIYVRLYLNLFYFPLPFILFSTAKVVFKFIQNKFLFSTAIFCSASAACNIQRVVIKLSE